MTPLCRYTHVASLVDLSKTFEIVDVCIFQVEMVHYSWMDCDRAPIYLGYIYLDGNLFFSQVSSRSIEKASSDMGVQWTRQQRAEI